MGKRGHPSMKKAIVMHDVSKTFRGTQALSDVSWDVSPGSIYGLIGANGAGKSTLLQLSLGVLWPDRGDITILGEALTRDSSLLRQRVHYVASGRPMVQSFRVEEWLRYTRLLYTRWDQTLCDTLLSALDISPEKALGQLSQGTQTSLQLLIAIAARPDLLLLDEPTNGLDVVVKQQILQFIIDMAADLGTTVVMATHNLQDVERIADTIGVLYRGHFVLQEELDTMKSHWHRIQVVIPGPWPDEIGQGDQISHVERRGHVAQITVEGDPGPVIHTLQKAGASLIEPINMDLTEIFRSLLEKEGYSREALRWTTL